MGLFSHKKDEIERCPACGSIYIQYNERTDKCYCLERECKHTWEEELNFYDIKNPYLRTSIKHIPA